jgi:hypothetical protein
MLNILIHIKHILVGVKNDLLAVTCVDSKVSWLFRTSIHAENWTLSGLESSAFQDYHPQSSGNPLGLRFSSKLSPL